MEDEPSYSSVFDATVKAIKFSISTPSEIHTYSINDSPITHPTQLSNPFLGLPLETGKCEACGMADIEKCEGHFGFIELPIPLYHPSHVGELINVLNLVCLKCMRMKKGKIKKGSGSERVTCATCFNCRKLPAISIVMRKTEANKDGAFSLELKVPSKTRLPFDFWSFMDKFGFHYNDGNNFRPLLPCEAQKIFKGISVETAKKLSDKGYFLQDGFILQCLPVPPNCLYVPEITDGKCIMSSDLSIPLLRRLLKEAESIKRSRSGDPNFVSLMSESVELQSTIAQYMHLRGTTKAPQNLWRKTLLGVEASECSKRWLEKMKTLFISKGSGFSSRNVISGDSYIRLNEIGLPAEVARRITFEERVTTYNKNFLQKLVDDRLCVMYKEGFSKFAISVGSKGHVNLKVGQTISRQIMDGDLVFINRPPSTHKHSLQAFTVFVHEDHVVKINPLVCDPFGADFDGDCIHIFYPQSLQAKAEVKELFTVEKQLLSSHSGRLNLQLVQDSLLALKKMSFSSFFDKIRAQQLSMFICPNLSQPALLKARNVGPLWTVTQLIQNAFPACFNTSCDRHVVSGSEILFLDFNSDALRSTLTDIVTSIVVAKGAEEALHFFNLLQPFLMEFLSMEGFSVDLRDFYVSKDVIETLRRSANEICPILEQLRSAYNELVDQQIENHFKYIKIPIVRFVLKLSALGNLIDTKSDSSILKIIQQLGFVGLQLFQRGKLYSRVLIENIFSHFVLKCSVTESCYPTEAYGLVTSSFFHGLNPYEELIHSISSREEIVRSSRGLTEPGTLFKSLMAALRDVVICYDGTVRNVCSNSIIQFEYVLDENDDSFMESPPGEPVGVLAATAISNPAYKAVLEASRVNNSSWELMKEILLARVKFVNEEFNRRAVLYLNKCCCGRRFCDEKSALAIERCLKRVTLRDCALEFHVEHQLQPSQSETCIFSRLFGHVHLDQTRLRAMNVSMDDVIQKCQDALFINSKKKSPFSHFFRSVSLSECECCSSKDSNYGSSTEFSCVRFSYRKNTAGSTIHILEKSVDIFSSVLLPVLLDTIIKGDTRVHSVNILWIGSDGYSWVRNSSEVSVGELALEVLIEKHVVRRNGDAWRTTLDACLPVMHLIDTKRSIPYGIRQMQEFLGISCAFEQSILRLMSSTKMVAKGVLKDHLVLIANSMTCTGNLIGFNKGAYKHMFRSLKVQVPFTEATLYTPVKCFERAAEKCHKDSLSSIVSSCCWGKHVPIGTGTHFQIIWDKYQLKNDEDYGEDVYDFLELVCSPCVEVSGGALLGVDVDNLMDGVENNEFSPERDATFYDHAFEEIDEGKCNGVGNSSWDKDFSSSTKYNASLNWEDVKEKRTESSHVQPSNPVLWSSWGSEKIQDQTSLDVSDSLERVHPPQTWSSWEKVKVPDTENRDGFCPLESTWDCENVHDKKIVEVSHSPERAGSKLSQSSSWDTAAIVPENSMIWDMEFRDDLQHSWDPKKAPDQLQDKQVVHGSHSSEKVSSQQTWSSWDTIKVSEGSHEEEENKHSFGTGDGQVNAVDKFNKSANWNENVYSNPKSQNKGWNGNKPSNPSGRRSSLYTDEEEKIIAEVNPIMLSVRRILRESSGQLSADDQAFIVDNVFKYHPDRQSKVTDEIDHIKADHHTNFTGTRCFFVVSTDGSCVDFSYLKCMENFVKEKFPENAESFNRKFFRRYFSNDVGRPRAQNQEQNNTNSCLATAFDGHGSGV